MTALRWCWKLWHYLGKWFQLCCKCGALLSHLHQVCCYPLQICSDIFRVLRLNLKQQQKNPRLNPLSYYIFELILPGLPALLFLELWNQFLQLVSLIWHNHCVEWPKACRRCEQFHLFLRPRGKCSTNLLTCITKVYLEYHFIRHCKWSVNSTSKLIDVFLYISCVCKHFMNLSSLLVNISNDFKNSPCVRWSEILGGLIFTNRSFIQYLPWNVLAEIVKLYSQPCMQFLLLFGLCRNLTYLLVYTSCYFCLHLCLRLKKMVFFYRSGNKNSAYSPCVCCLIVILCTAPLRVLCVYPTWFPVTAAF